MVIIGDLGSCLINAIAAAQLNELCSPQYSSGGPGPEKSSTVNRTIQYEAALIS